MQSKLFLIIAFILVFGGAVFAMVWFWTSRLAAEPQSAGSGIFDPQVILPLGGGSQKQGTQGGTGSVPTIELPVYLGTVPVNDFTKSKNATTSDDGSYVVLIPRDTYPADPFEIVFIKADNSFIVSLLEEPLGEARRQATQFLMSELGISAKTVCRLVAEVGVQRGVNDFYSGKSLGFPGCTGATTLPGD